MRIRYGWELALAALLVIEIVAFGAINPRMLDLNMLLFSTSDFICIGIVALPIVIAGGKKLPEREALEMCWQAIDQGASGVDMGRNIFQSDHPVAMMKAVQAVVHHNETADRAYELYLSEKQ